MTDFAAFIFLLLVALAVFDPQTKECKERGGVPGWGVCFDPKVLK